jgi:hypothetical protein
MRSVACRAAFKAPYEGVRAARRPHAVELARVPDGLECDLRDADGVGGRAFGRVGETFRGYGVVHVRGVVGGVEVDAVPASS